MIDVVQLMDSINITRIEQHYKSTEIRNCVSQSHPSHRVQGAITDVTFKLLNSLSIGIVDIKHNVRVSTKSVAAGSMIPLM